jgi:hypothetical protein
VEQGGLYFYSAAPGGMQGLAAWGDSIMNGWMSMNWCGSTTVLLHRLLLSVNATGFSAHLDQLRRAGASIGLNLAEGGGEYTERESPLLPYGSPICHGVRRRAGLAGGRAGHDRGSDRTCPGSPAQDHGDPDSAHPPERIAGQGLDFF